jgi:hypothetical protein
MVQWYEERFLVDYIMRHIGGNICIFVVLAKNGTMLRRKVFSRLCNEAYWGKYMYFCCFDYEWYIVMKKGF